jgi:hypothetical protein
MFMTEAFEPKYGSRFKVTIGDPFKIHEYVIHRVTRPEACISKNRILWKDMVFAMYDPITQSTTKSILEGLMKLKNQGSQTIKITIAILDAVGDKVEEWSLHGEIIKVVFGNLDWTSAGPSEILFHYKVYDAILTLTSKQ